MRVLTASYLMLRRLPEGTGPCLKACPALCAGHGQVGSQAAPSRLPAEARHGLPLALFTLTHQGPKPKLDLRQNVSSALVF